MRTWSAECYGTITRDIRWVDVDAETEQEAREIVAREMPMHEVKSIIPADISSGLCDTTTPARADGSQDNQNS